MRLRSILEDAKLAAITEMPLHSYTRVNGTEGQSGPIKSKNYEKALIKFMRNFPGPDWIVIISNRGKFSRDNWKEQLIETGIPESTIDNCITFLHDGYSVQKEQVTPWILTHNFAHSDQVGIDGMSHSIYSLLGHETKLSDDELNDKNGRAQEFTQGMAQSYPDQEIDLYGPASEYADPAGLWLPANERKGRGEEFLAVADKVRSDLKFRSAQSTIDIDELSCELFVEFMKHNGKIRSKNGLDYSKVESLFHKILISRTGRLTSYDTSP